jgi:hypothetical protein
LPVLEDKNDWICERGAKNINRLKKICTQFKFKNDPKRIGPLTSATFYANNTYKIGKNKNIWIIKGYKWTDAKIDMITLKFALPVKNILKDKLNTKKNDDHKIYMFLNKYNHVGLYSDAPIFIANIDAEYTHILYKIYHNNPLYNK